MVYTVLRASAPQSRSRKICFRSLKNVSQDHFLRDLHTAPFHIIELFDDVDDKIFAFELLYNDILNEHAPLKQVHIRGNQVPYMTEQWRKAIRHRNRLWKKFTRERTDANYADYKTQRNKCTSLRRKAIKEHFLKKTMAPDSPRDFWDAYRPFIHSKKTKQANDIILKENNIVTDKKEISELFNNHFVHIADGVPEINETDYGEDFIDHPSIKAINEQSDKRSTPVCFNFQRTNQEQIKKLLLGSNARKSCGHDMIPPRFIKESAAVIAEPLAKIINSSIDQRRYPTRWKMGQVTPLFKKEDELVKLNYRPVTVLPALNNIYERLLASQLSDFYRNVLSDFTSAYRKYYSCETSLLRMTEDWRSMRDKGELVAVMSMDLSKAFDVIPHSLLLAKLKAYGLGEESCALLRDYLNERSQRVKIGDTYSTWKLVRRGVPQGSVLGPMLFNIFMNDLFYHVRHTKLNVYADDQQIYDSDVDPVNLEERITHDVLVANQWYRNNGMIVNESKHQAMVLGTTDHTFSFAVKPSIDIFGMSIDNKLCFDNYISTICRKINNQFSVMLRLHKLISSDTMLKLYRAFILPNFQYCSTVWHHCGARNAEKLEALNRRILRFILKDYSSSYDQLLHKVNLTTLSNRRLQSMLILLYKSLFVENYPNYMRNMFTPRSANYNLRGHHILSLSKPRTTAYGLHTFNYLAAKLWNSLPDGLRACADLEEFKRKILSFVNFNI